MPKKNKDDILLEKFIENVKMLINEVLKQDVMFDMDKACKYLGLSKSTLYKLTMNGEIPHYKPTGKKIYFSKIEIDNWVKTNVPRGEE
jgi:excisionase family DNA binding protein